MKICLLTFTILMLMACNESPKPKPVFTLYVGTYTGGGSQGIYSLDFNADNGELTNGRLLAKLPNPSYLALSADGHNLYAVQETDDFDALGGGVTAFRRVRDTLEPLGSLGTSGAHPCHLELSGDGHLAVANYTGGNVAVFPLQENGALGKPPQILDHTLLDSTKAAHAHMARFTPDGLLVADLGLDALKRYRLEGGRFVPGDPPSLPFVAGAGPRHFDFGEQGKYLYVINELNSSISVFERDGKGRYSEIQVVETLDPSFSGNNACADLHLSPDGRFLYGSNRGENSIVIFSVDPDSGTLSLVGRESVLGDWPRNFTLDPSGEFLLVGNQRSGNIVVFKRDVDSGALAHLSTVELADPACLVFGQRPNDPEGQPVPR